MSPKGTQFCSEVNGSHAVLKPCLARLDSIPSASVTHALAPAAASASAIDGFSPPGRKKFISGELTHGPSGPDPQGKVPVPTVNGLAADCPAASADSKFATIRSPRTVLALIGRFRCRPPL